MSAQERWDVVLKVLDGPLAGLGEQVLRGPVVRIGVNPGPGGFALTGYRGLDARHAVITAYDGGTVTIGPVGSNQVRIAPHPNVNWKDIDPVGAPQYLNAGGAIHLGPVGRGATLEFVKAQRLGEWQQGNLASEASAANSAQIKAPSGGPPAAYSAKSNRVGVISTQMAPVWFVGCMFLMASASVTLLLAVALVWKSRQIDELGPRVEGEYFTDFATVDKAKLESLGLLKGLQEPFGAFVMKYDIQASDRDDLAKPENWDQEFYDRVAASVLQHVQYKATFRRFEEITQNYETVTELLQEADLPEVFAGIPYRESTYKDSLQSIVCAKGWWQFMPEVAYHLEHDKGMKFRVKSCHFGDADGTWEPSTPTPPAGVMKNARYMSSGACRITKCDIDDRTDLELSTKAAIATLGEAYQDPELRASGALVQIVIASHNAGYNDEALGVKKTGNMLPAYDAWKKGKPKSEWPNFYGENITCTNPDDLPAAKVVDGHAIPTTNSVAPTKCPYPGTTVNSPMHAETQHYVYPIIARHILAVCYYGKNHSDMKAFQNWAVYSSGTHYCTQFGIPTPAEIR